MHKWLVKFLKVIDVRILYVFAFVFIVPPTMLFNRASRISTYNFYRKCFGFGFIKSLWMTYRNHCSFSQVVIDKFAMYAGKKFHIDIDGYENFHELSMQPEGFVQLSSHVGNYEIAGYSLVAKTKRFNAVVFGGEKASVMENRGKLFDGNNIRMIPILEDMSHLFVIDQALANGEILSIAADRVSGSQKVFRIDFMGKEAGFPQGPFIMASMRHLPVLFVSVMKTAAKKYKIDVKKIDCPEQGNTRARANKIAEKYVTLLENTVREHPAQWYNYFDFWAN